MIGSKENTLQEISYTDALTQVPNIRYFNQELEKLHSIWERHQQSYAIILFDLDNLKYVNDHYGHKKGDQYIRHTTQNCSALVRKEDTFARIGGDEFAVLLPNASLANAKSLAERIALRLQEYRPEISSIHAGSASFGCASVSSFKGITHTELYEAADMALYKSKEKGKNTISVTPEGDL